MSEEFNEQDLIGELAEEFLQRLRKGERPDWQDYADRYPDMADEVRELFPAMMLMEQTRSSQIELHEAAPNDVLRGLRGERLERLGEYRILREVGRGGMGVVFEAEHESLSRRVALKILPTQALLDSRHVQRFQREARAAARLHHTNIVPVFDVGVQDGLHYYVMQFIQGLSLDEVLKELKRTDIAKQWSPVGDAAQNDREQAQHANCSTNAERSSTADSLLAVLTTESLMSGQFQADYWESVARIGVQVADALSYAISQGVQHRDIKPSNLLLDTLGTVWITDFGLAKATPASVADEGRSWESESDLTYAGDVVGTLRYLAPERLSGQSDQRGDIYSLGITLYELITKQPAFNESDRTKLVRQIAEDEPRRPRSLAPAVPRDLETIVMMAMRKDPNDRYQTAAELASDLRCFLENKPIRARRTRPLERLWRWSRRNPLVASLSTTLAVLFAVIGVGLPIGQLLRSERDQAVVNEELAKQAEGRVRDLLNRALSAESEVKIRSHLALASSYRRSGQPGRRYKSLVELTKAVALNPSSELSDELRNEAIASMALVDVQATVGPPVAVQSGIMFDQSYRQYAFFDEHGKVHIRRVGESADTTELAGVGSSNAELWFSSQGRYVGATRVAGGPTQLWQVASGEPVFRKPLPAYVASVSPDESLVALGMRDGSVIVYELPSGRVLRRRTTDGVPRLLAFHPFQRRVAVGLSEPPRVQIWDLESDEIVSDLTGIEAPIHAVTWAPDGVRLSLSLAEPAKRAEIWDAVTRKRLMTLEGHAQDVVASKFLRSGTLLMTSSWDGTTRIWDAKTARTLITFPGGIANTSDAGNRILGIHYQQNLTQAIELIGADEYRTLVSSLGPGQGEYRDGAISPDGQLLAVGMDDGVRIWDLSGGREVAYLPIGATPSPVFSPGGNELITSGESGTLRWPLVVDGAPAKPNSYPTSEYSNASTKSRAIHFGPPHTIPIAIVPHYARGATDGRGLAICDAQADQSLVVNLGTETVETTINTNPRTDRVVLSPDGRWVATSGWHATTVQVWDARTAALEKELPLGTLTFADFSPDAKQLITSRADEFCFWEVGSWRKINTIARENCPYPGKIAFAPDGSTMALELSSAVVSFLDVATGRTLAKLEDPHHDRPGCMSFTPDGSQFVVVSTYSKNIHVWNLRLIRDQLATMGLDWSPVSNSVRVDGAADDSPLRATVDLGKFDSRAKAKD